MNAKLTEKYEAAESRTEQETTAFKDQQPIHGSNVIDCERNMTGLFSPDALGLTYCKSIRPVNNASYPENKEVTGSKQAVVYCNGELKNPVTVKWFMGRSSSASKVYCCLWVKGEDLYTSGSGTAAGYGYHKPSAAFGNAVRSAGIELDTDVDGRGDSAVDEAILAIVRALGYRGKVLIV